MLEALCRVLLVEALAREAPGAILAAILLDVKVHAAGGDVRKSGVDYSLYQGEHVADVISRARPHTGRREIEGRAIAPELVEVKVGDFERRLALRARGFLDLVLALIDVARHVPDIGHVHHVADLVAVEFEGAAEAVDENVGAQIAEMLRQ